MPTARDSDARHIQPGNFANARLLADDGEGGPSYIAATDLAEVDDITKLDIENGVLVATKRDGSTIRATLPAFTESQDDITGLAISNGKIVLTRRNGSTFNVSLPEDSTTSPDDFTGGSVQNGNIVLTRRNGTTLTLNLPSTAESQDDITAARFSGNSIIFTRRNGTEFSVQLPARTTGDVPEDTWAQQFSIIEIASTAQDDAHSIPAGTTTAQSENIALSSSIRQDEAQIGLDHNSGDTEFANLHADQPTPLRATGQVPLFVRPTGSATTTPDCDLRILWQRIGEDGNAAGAPAVLAQHGIDAVTERENLDIPLGDAVFNALRGTTNPLGGSRYRLRWEITPRTPVPAGGMEVGVRANADDSHLVAFRRWISQSELPAGAQNGQLLGFENGEADWQTIIKTPQRSAQQTEETYVRSTGSGANTGLSHQPVDEMPFLHPVTQLPDHPSRQGQLISLTEIDGTHHPDFYMGRPNPVPRNEVRGTVRSRTITMQGQPVTEYGIWEDGVTQGREAVAKASWFTFNGVTTFNIWLREDLAAQRASIFSEVRSSETADLVDTDFNRTTGVLVDEGENFRQYQSAAPLTQTEKDALAEIQDETGDNDLALLIFSAAAGARGEAVLFLKRYVWDEFLSQANLRKILEVPRAQRQLHGDKILADWPAAFYSSTAEAIADNVLQRPPGTMVAIQADRSDEVALYLVSKAFPSTDATPGAHSERNRVDALMTDGSHGISTYCDLFLYPSEKRGFENQPDGSAVDPQGRIGVISLRTATVDEPASVFASIDSSFHNEAMLGVTIANRLGAHGTARAMLQAELTKLAGNDASSTRGARTFAQYQWNLSPSENSSLLDSAGWAFANRIGSFRFYTRGQARGGAALNFNPNTPAFTSGAGYAAGSDAIAARLVQIGG